MPAMAFDVARRLVSVGLTTHNSRHSLVIGFLQRSCADRFEIMGRNFSRRGCKNESGCQDCLPDVGVRPEYLMNPEMFK